MKITLQDLELACIGLQDIKTNKLNINNIIAITNMLDYFDSKMKNYFQEKKKIFEKHETIKGSLRVDPVTPEFAKELMDLQQVEIEIEEQIKPVFTEADRNKLEILSESFQNTKDFVDWGL